MYRLSPISPPAPALRLSASLPAPDSPQPALARGADSPGAGLTSPPLLLRRMTLTQPALRRSLVPAFNAVDARHGPARELRTPERPRGFEPERPIRPPLAARRVARVLDFDAASQTW